MSKAAAMQLLTGLPSASAKPSLITPDVDPNKVAEPVTPESTETPDTTVEAKPEETVNSNRLAILAKREVALQKEREQIKKEREEFLKEKEEADRYKTRGQQFDDMAKKDKVAALKLLGWSDTDIINIMAGADTKEPSAEDIARRVAQEEAQKIRDELKQQAEEDQKLQNEKLITNLKSDITDLIKSEAEKYEYCAFEGEEAEAKAYDFISKILKDDGVLITVEEALKMTEDYYEERDKAMASLKKRQPKPAETPVEPEKKDPPAGTVAARRENAGAAPVSNTPPAKPKTLTNAMSATTQAAMINRRESPSEKRERLINALKNGTI